MSLPRELSRDANGALRAWPVCELDNARRKTLLTRLIDERGTIAISLSARSDHATEVRIPPVRGEPTAITIRLAGPGSEDVEIRVSADGVRITEGSHS